jgi:hypothetical protein
MTLKDRASITVRPRVRAQESGSASCETVQDMLNIAATAEAFAVTALGVAVENATNGTLAITAEALGSLQAARAAEQAHYDYLTENGATATTTTFTIPDETIFTDAATFLTTFIGLEEAFIAAYIAAAQQFCSLGETDLAQVALQIGAVEAEHRVGLRFFAVEAGVLAGTPNDVAFEKVLFSTLSEAADALAALGFINGSGTSIDYPGPGDIDSSIIRNLKP